MAEKENPAIHNEKRQAALYAKDGPGKGKGGPEDVHGRHSRERAEMHKRHGEARDALHKLHAKEHDDINARQDAELPAPESQGMAAAGTDSRGQLEAGA
jgi:hypothetical protein